CFGDALRRGKGAETAAVFYSVTMTVNALTWAAVWLYASAGRRLLSPEFPESQRKTSTLLFVGRHRLLCDLHRDRVVLPHPVPGVPRGTARLRCIRPHLPACRAFAARMRRRHGRGPVRIA